MKLFCPLDIVFLLQKKKSASKKKVDLLKDIFILFKFQTNNKYLVSVNLCKGHKLNWGRHRQNLPDWLLVPDIFKILGVVMDVDGGSQAAVSHQSVRWG